MKYDWMLKDTPIGVVGIIWKMINGKPVIFRVMLPQIGLKKELSRFGEEKPFKVDDLLESEIIKIENLALHICPAFQKMVLLFVHRIPRGRVSTYGHIAQELGIRGARSIGKALASNPFPLIIPCHRVIKSDGSLGGFQGGKWMKKVLLEKEGIKFDENDKILDKNKIIGTLGEGGFIE